MDDSDRTEQERTPGRCGRRDGGRDGRRDRRTEEKTEGQADWESGGVETEGRM